MSTQDFNEEDRIFLQSQYKCVCQKYTTKRYYCELNGRGTSPVLE